MNEGSVKISCIAGNNLQVSSLKTTQILSLCSKNIAIPDSCVLIR
jgi:hypothetical protein